MRPALILIFLLFTGISPVSANQTALDDRFAYGLYAGGIRALDIELGFHLHPDRYDIAMKAKPYGLLGGLLPWAGHYTTTGKHQASKLIPQSHLKVSQWRDDKDTDKFTYENGVLVSLKRTDTEKKPLKEENVPLDKTLHQGSVDLLTATLYPLMQMNDGKACDAAIDVFDGKRRFVLKFTKKGTETLVASKYNMFSGKTVICQVEMIPVAGFKGKKRGYYKLQEEGRAQGQLPKIWMGRAGKNGAYVPVKIMMKSEYGAVLVHVEKNLP